MKVLAVGNKYIAVFSLVFRIYFLNFVNVIICYDILLINKIS